MRCTSCTEPASGVVGGRPQCEEHMAALGLPGGVVAARHVVAGEVIDAAAAQDLYRAAVEAGVLPSLGGVALPWRPTRPRFLSPGYVPKRPLSVAEITDHDAAFLRGLGIAP